jgi:hypothetical protein
MHAPVFEGDYLLLDVWYNFHIMQDILYSANNQGLYGHSPHLWYTRGNQYEDLGEAGGRIT